jgi:glucose-6-phosphate 1-dehydrogenase
MADNINEGRTDIETPPADPCIIVILGASGDLTSRKLIPELFSLYQKGGLPERFELVGCARSPMTKEQFRTLLADSVHDITDKTEGWEQFCTHIHYQELIYDSGESYAELSRFLQELDTKNRTGGNKIFYLALPMFLYGTTVEMLGEAGLSSQMIDGIGWSRIVVEKPYGSDRASAAELDATIHKYFDERQVFRIDHYLAKETVQNLLMFRFANTIFEPLWNRNYIDRVDIIACESLGVEKRAGYYEKSGVLRDMFQNHMMQLLALTAMEPPISFESDPVHDEKIKVFRSLRPMSEDNVFENVVLGQYGPGTVNGKKVRGYREEEGVDQKSLTPTYGSMRVFIDNWRWKGIPFYLTSGKRLASKLTQVSISFKEVPISMFRDVLGEHITANVLTLGIHPEERITLKFQTKSPGAKVCLRSVTMDFNYLQGYTGVLLDAYEKALLDCMHGDQMLFWHHDGIDLTWEFMEPILEQCETCSDRVERLKPYEAGSWGPVEAAELKNRKDGGGAWASGR